MAGHGVSNFFVVRCVLYSHNCVHIVRCSREGCDLSCNLHTGVRICLVSVVECYDHSIDECYDSDSDWEASKDLELAASDATDESDDEEAFF